jgi:UDP-glucose 4-epimerase
MILPRRIAVLGANGFVGTALSHALAERGCIVVAGVRTAAANPSPNVIECVSSYSTPEDFKKFLSHVDVIVHVASANTVASSLSLPHLELDCDLSATAALIEALGDRSDIRLVYFSSGGTVYGRSPHGSLIDEDTPPAPLSYHGASKLSAETFLRVWAVQRNASLTILRPANIYGPGQLARAGFGVIPALFRCASEKLPFRLRGSLSTTRDFLFVDDLVDLVLKILGSSAHAETLVCNAGSGVGTALGELIPAVEKISGNRLEIQKSNALKGEIESIVLDIRTAGRRFGWHPSVGLTEGLERTWDWWRANHGPSFFRDNGIELRSEKEGE